MKKIVLLIVLGFVLSSCGNNISEKELNSNKSTTIEKKQEVVNTKENNESTNITKPENNIQEQKTQGDEIKVSENTPEPIFQEEKVEFSELVKNLKKAKELGIEQEELRFLNDELKNIISRKIYDKVKQEKNIDICNQLESQNEINSCKRNFIINDGDIKGCDKLESGKVSCKNEIYKKQAKNNLDEKLCEKIQDNTEEKFEINQCKQDIILEKARKNLDEKLCEKIQDEGIKMMCLDMIKQEKEMKKMEIQQINQIEK